MTLEDTAVLLSSHWFLKFIMTFHIVTSTAGIVALVHMELRKRTRSLLAHKSLTLLMNMHSLWTFLLCLATLIHNVTTMYTHLTMQSPCDLIVTASTCIVRRVPMFVAIYGSIFSQMAMAAERYSASNDLANYEYTSRSRGLWLNAAHLAAVIISVNVHVWYLYGTDWTAAHCTIVKFGGIKYVILAFVLGSCELWTIGTFKRLLSRNCRLRDNHEALLTLSERYQLAENIRMLKHLFPVIISHTSFGLLGAVLFVVLTVLNLPAEMYPMIEEAINWIYLQGICMPIIFAIRSRQEKHHNSKVISLNTTTGVELATHHTRAITEGW